MNEAELNKFGKFLFHRYFKEELTIPIKINNRLKRVHAWLVPYFMPIEHSYIEVSKHLAQQSIYIIADILMHELTHYYLFKNNKPYTDEDIEFKALTYKNGINHTRVAKVCDDGVMRYEYWQHESKCECGFKITSFLPTNSKDTEPILICPSCNSRLSFNAIGTVYEDFLPPFQLEVACKTYLDDQSAVLSGVAICGIS